MSLWKLLKIRRFSLVQEYLYFTAAVLFIIIGSSFFLLYQTIDTFEKERQLLLFREAKQLQMFFDERIKYVEHILQFIGTKIRLTPDQRSENIANMVKYHRANFNDESFSWNILTLLSPDLLLIADSKNGLLKVPIKFDTERRGWIKEVQREFWKVKFSQPDIALVSNDYILPIGISIPAISKKNPRPMWYLATGISIDRLTSRLMKAATDTISFVIIDHEQNIITSSEPTILSLKKQLPGWLANHSNGTGVDKMYKKLSIGNYDFTYAAHSEQYPFVILVGQARNVYHQQLQDALLPRILIYLTVGSIIALTMMFLGYQVIKPILALGKAAEAISHGRAASIPKYQQHELRVLANQLQKIDSVTKDLRAKQVQLSKMNNELQNANAFIKNNMSFLSHELTNPIASILGFAQLLQKKLQARGGAEEKEYSDMIYKTAIYQSKQLNFFLRLFQFQESRKKVETKEIDLKEAIEWNVSMARHHAQDKNVRITIKVEQGLKMMGDEIMVGQLIQNLAANGAKYNREDGTLAIKAYSRYANQIAIEFTDTGFGIAKRDISRIFKKFTRLSNTEQKKNIGYGIGLAYAKRCALVHGGKIMVRSKPGVGSTFIVIMQKNGRVIES